MDRCAEGGGGAEEGREWMERRLSLSLFLSHSFFLTLSFPSPREKNPPTLYFSAQNLQRLGAKRQRELEKA